MANFRSKFEEKVYKDLKDKVKVSYEPDKIPYTISRNYVPDFRLHTKDDRTFYIEAKGYLRYADAEKMVAVKNQNPDIDIRIVFERNNPVRKGSKMKYSDWAEKNGFTYSVGYVPKDWLEEGGL